MAKQKKITATPELVAQIERATGVTVDGDEIVIFEAAALSTKPLSKRGSIFHEARPSRQLLVDMAEAMMTGQASVPLHLNHQQGHEMPSGRVFAASVSDQSDGSSILNAMFYLPKSETSLIEKINLGVLDEVSVGVRSQQGLCSKCGFDYFGPDADFMNLFDQTCDNGHTIGVDGAHLKMVGLGDWMELSLVSRGASNKPKIKSHSREGAPERMAASGVPLDALVLYASAPTEIDEMDLKKIEEMLGSFGEKLTAMEGRFDALDGTSAELTTAQARVAELEASAAELEEAKAKIAELEAAAVEGTEAKAKVEELEGKVAELTKEPEPVPAPAGGVALSSQSTSKDNLQASAAPRSTAFKTNRNR